jgi:hypothetical protein
MERSDFTMWTGSSEQLVAHDGPTTDDEDRRVHAWRAEQLQGLGLSRLVAQRFAPLVDWHEVAALVARDARPSSLSRSLSQSLFRQAHLDSGRQRGRHDRAAHAIRARSSSSAPWGLPQRSRGSS